MKLAPSASEENEPYNETVVPHKGPRPFLSMFYESLALKTVLVSIERMITNHRSRKMSDGGGDGGGGYSSGGDSGYSGGSSDGAGAYIGGSSDGGYSGAMSGAYQGSSTSSYTGESPSGSPYGSGNAYNSSNSAGMAYSSDGVEGRLGPFNWETGGFGPGQPTGLAGLVAGEQSYGYSQIDYMAALKESMGKFNENPYKHHTTSCAQCGGLTFKGNLCQRCAVRPK